MQRAQSQLQNRVEPGNPGGNLLPFPDDIRFGVLPQRTEPDQFALRPVFAQKKASIPQSDQIQ